MSNLSEKEINQTNNDTINNKYMDKFIDIKNDKIKKSLIELSKVFKKK